MTTEQNKDGRLTPLQQTRRSWDYIIAAHYYHGAGNGPRKIASQVGYRTVAKLFVMPMSTVRGIVKRTPRADPEVRHAAMRFGLIQVRMGGLEGGSTARQQDISNLFSDIPK